MKKQKFKNSTVERLTALRGILNMQERAIEAGEPCKLNGESRTFDMRAWDCETAACALGSAALHPWFKERGLRIKNYVPAYRSYRDFDSGKHFFGITKEESFELFSAVCYTSTIVTPAMVRDRVDALIEKYSK